MRKYTPDLPSDNRLIKQYQNLIELATSAEEKERLKKRLKRILNRKEANNYPTQHYES